MLMRCVTSTFDCRTRTQRQSKQACAGNCVRLCTDLWIQHNGGESITLKSWRREDSREAWLLRATFSTKTWRRTFWFTAMIFHSGPTGGAKACTEFAAGCIRTEQSCDSGPGVVAVTDSVFLGQDTDIATVGNRVRA